MVESTKLMDVVMDDCWLTMLRMNQWNEWMREPRDGVDTNVMNFVNDSYLG